MGRLLLLIFSYLYNRIIRRRKEKDSISNRLVTNREKSVENTLFQESFLISKWGSKKGRNALFWDFITHVTINYHQVLLDG